MKQAPALVSIGMPIYNAEKYLTKAIDSLLTQNYVNVELIISDNASTDQTSEICRQYAAKDKRIRYYNNKENMGASFNFMRVLQLAEGRYFMWAAHDDEWEKFYISELVDCLETLGPNFVAASFEAQYMDAAGNRFDFFEEGLPFYDYQSESLIERLAHMLRYNYGNLVYGLYRCEVLQKAKLIFVENEIPFLLQVVQTGNWRVLPGVGFYKRTVLSTYQQARWEKRGGILHKFIPLNLSVLRNSFEVIKYSFKYHKVALKNIQYSIRTLDLNDQDRISLNALARKIIWTHFAHVLLGYK